MHHPKIQRSDSFELYLKELPSTDNEHVQPRQQIYSFQPRNKRPSAIEKNAAEIYSSFKLQSHEIISKNLEQIQRTSSTRNFLVNQNLQYTCQTAVLRVDTTNYLTEICSSFSTALFLTSHNTIPNKQISIRRLRISIAYKSQTRVQRRKKKNRKLLSF